MTGLAHRFTEDDQRWFAQVSGDANPLHMDAVWASMTFPGERVVHGLHAALWALETYLRETAGARLDSVRARFVKPIVVGDEVALSIRPDALRISVRGETMVVIHLKAAVALDSFPASSPAHPVSIPPRDRSQETDLLGLSDAILLPDPAQALGRRFPHLVAAFGEQAVSGLAGISTIVGMECPGLHSVLSEFSAARSSGPAARELAFHVRKHHAVFSRVEIQFRGSGIEGTVAAFAGRADPDPLSDEEIRGLVDGDDYGGQQPLLIGASSGLGAATARLLAAGGAQPVVSWHKSRGAIENVEAAVSALGGRCKAIPFDVRAPTESVARLAADGWKGREVYYFASPRIFRRRIQPFQADDLRDFLAVYVEGFYETVRALAQCREPAPLRVFYPSSTALDEVIPELFEYKLAKAAGEELCRRLQEIYPAISIVVVRLPRIVTRQTKTSLLVEAELPERIMAPIVRRMQTSGVNGPDDKPSERG